MKFQLCSRCCCQLAETSIAGVPLCLPCAHKGAASMGRRFVTGQFGPAAPAPAAPTAGTQYWASQAQPFSQAQWASQVQPASALSPQAQTQAAPAPQAQAQAAPAPQAPAQPSATPYSQATLSDVGPEGVLVPPVGVYEYLQPGSSPSQETQGSPPTLSQSIGNAVTSATSSVTTLLWVLGIAGLGLIGWTAYRAHRASVAAGHFLKEHPEVAVSAITKAL